MSLHSHNYVVFYMYTCTWITSVIFLYTNKQTNKQTNALLSIKTPTMSNIINKDHSIQLIHIIIFPLDRKIKKNKKNKIKKSH